MISRQQISENFTQIPNQFILDSRLKANEFRVMCYLFSRPIGWKVNNSNVMKVANIKTSATLSEVWKRLISFGYIARKEIKVKGKFLGYNYEILNPWMKDKTDSGKTDNGLTDDGLNRNGLIGGHSNTDSNSNTDINKTKSKSDPQKKSLTLISNETKLDIDLAELKKRIGTKQTEMLNNFFEQDGKVVFGKKMISASLDWLEYRKQKKKPVSLSAFKRLNKKFSQMDEEYSCLLIENAILNDYQGCVFPDTVEKYKGAKKGKKEGSNFYMSKEEKLERDENHYQLAYQQQLKREKDENRRG